MTGDRWEDHDSSAAPAAARLDNPSVQVSWGELLDKLTILEIKEKRLRSPAAVANVAHELALLRTASVPAVGAGPDLTRLVDELRQVNEMLWDIEDAIRAKEAAGTFDAAFIELARGVYIQNDRRGGLKRRINELMKSALVEEKQYTPYGREGAPPPG